jgi:hypothetical protein
MWTILFTQNFIFLTFSSIVNILISMYSILIYISSLVEYDIHFVPIFSKNICANPQTSLITVQYNVVIQWVSQTYSKGFFHCYIFKWPGIDFILKFKSIICCCFVFFYFIFIQDLNISVVIDICLFIWFFIVLNFFEDLWWGWSTLCQRIWFWASWDLEFYRLQG